MGVAHTQAQQAPTQAVRAALRAALVAGVLTADTAATARSPQLPLAPCLALLLPGTFLACSSDTTNVALRSAI